MRQLARRAAFSLRPHLGATKCWRSCSTLASSRPQYGGKKFSRNWIPCILLPQTVTLCIWSCILADLKSCKILQGFKQAIGIFAHPDFIHFAQARAQAKFDQPGRIWISSLLIYQCSAENCRLLRKQTGKGGSSVTHRSSTESSPQSWHSHRQKQSQKRQSDLLLLWQLQAKTIFALRREWLARLNRQVAPRPVLIACHLQAAAKHPCKRELVTGAKNAAALRLLFTVLSRLPTRSSVPLERALQTGAPPQVAFTRKPQVL